MPRPGPRAYECVRRVWHSDRHHPIRGSLIQEIFRLVNEVHCSATKKNREWQEKLPVVVLKAEEIMYSKANSEAEYSDLQTLWDRVNDAINIIIRRDESTETGDLLQPCIEAALHLGCTPRRSSRSQRNDAPRDYLRPEKLEGTSVLDSNSNTKAWGNPASINPLIFHCPQFSTLDPINPFRPSLKDHQDRSLQSRNSNQFKKFLVLPKSSAPSDNHHAPPQTSASSNLWSVYPLYYNNQICPNEPKLGSLKPSNSKSQLMEIVENLEIGLQQQIPPCKLGTSESISPSNHDRTFVEERGLECDLTLRLGPLVVPCVGNENSLPPQVENGNRSILQRKKFTSHLNE